MSNSKLGVFIPTSKCLAAAAISMAGVVSAVNAAPVIYFGENLTPSGTVSGAPVTARNNFLAGLTGVGNENFEGIAAGTTPPLPLSFPGSSGSITATISTSSQSPGGVCNTSSGTVGAIGCNGFGRFPTSGTNWYHTTDQFQIGFSSPIAAFGFYATDIGDFSGQVTLTLVDGGTVSLVVPATINGPDGSLLFYGFIDAVNSYTSIAFGNTASGTDVFGFDDMVIGDQRQVVPGIPEPETYAMMLAGLGLLGFMARRRKQQAD